MLKAGLWEQDIRLLPYGSINYQEIFRLAQAQSITGLVTAGLEHAKDIKVPQESVFPFMSVVLSIEQQNAAMNHFIVEMIGKLREEGINSVLLKGQGIAQCYERPLWRASGDVDLFLDKEGFERAKIFFRPLVSKFDPDNEFAKSINMQYDSWIVEIHANQYTGISSKIDKVLDEIHEDIFKNQDTRLWQNGSVNIDLPSADNDVLLVFTHILKHLYKGGIGLRQICDWVRLLWTYKDSIDISLLKKRLEDMQLTTIWKAFGSLAVNILGIDSVAMPFYDSSQRWEKKSERLLSFILTTGNMGHNRDTSYYGRYPYLIRKMISLYIRIKDVICLSRIFPLDSLRFLYGITRNGVIDAVRFAK